MKLSFLMYRARLSFCLFIVLSVVCSVGTQAQRPPDYLPPKSKIEEADRLRERILRAETREELEMIQRELKTGVDNDPLRQLLGERLKQFDLARDQARCTTVLERERPEELRSYLKETQQGSCRVDIEKRYTMLLDAARKGIPTSENSLLANIARDFPELTPAVQAEQNQRSQVAKDRAKCTTLLDQASPPPSALRGYLKESDRKTCKDEIERKYAALLEAARKSFPDSDDATLQRLAADFPELANEITRERERRRIPQLCDVGRFTGATKPGGSSTTIIVSSTTRECIIHAYIDKAFTSPVRGLQLLQRPTRGTVEFRNPGLIVYKPRPGFTGTDVFSVHGSGSTNGQFFEWNARVTVISRK